MATDWTHIRVKQSTKTALHFFCQSLLTAHDQGKLSVAGIGDRLPTMDDAIRVLLERDQVKRQRSRKAKEKARQAKRRKDTDRTTTDS